MEEEGQGSLFDTGRRLEFRGLSFCLSRPRNKAGSGPLQRPMIKGRHRSCTRRVDWESGVDVANGFG